MNKMKQLVIALALALGFAGTLASVSVGAVSVFDPCANITDTTTAVCAGKDETVNPLIQTVVNTLLFVVGVVAVIVIIIGGLMYVTSSGDAGSVTKAKNTILYAVIGLVIALLSYAIVNWVMFRVSPSAAQQQCTDSGKTYDAKTKTCK